MGGHLLHFQKFSIFALKLQNSRFYTFLDNLNFRKFLGPGYPYVPLYPYDPPQKPKISKIFSCPKSCPHLFSGVFGRYPKIFWKISAYSEGTFLPKIAILGKIGENRKIFAQDGLHWNQSPQKVSRVHQHLKRSNLSLVSSNLIACSSPRGVPTFGQNRPKTGHLPPRGVPSININSL